MRAYKVTAAQDGQTIATRYAGTAASSKERRDELVEQFDLKKKDVTIEDCEIPTAKADLLEFINEVASGADLEIEE